MNRHYSKFGNLLREARAERDLTQVAVSRKLGYRSNYYERMERGNVLPTLHIFHALRRILAIDNVNDFMNAIPARVKPPRSTGRRYTAVRAPSRQATYYAFAMVLRRVRMMRGFGQHDVARSVGCSVPFYGRIENGIALPSLKLFAKLYRCLNFDAADLLDALVEGAPSAPYYELGSLICQARQRRDLTSKDVADAVGCTARDYERIEDGNALPSMETFVQLQDVLGFLPGSALHAVRRSPVWPQTKHA